MKDNKVTIFGAGGFIGSAMFSHFENAEFTVERGDWNCRNFAGQDLGTVIFCSGVGDCNRIEDVIYSHVDLLRNVINTAKYNYLIYISSTRIYIDGNEANETSSLKISFSDKRHLFNQVKLLGESIISSQSQPYLILRASNVYGKAFNSPLFLPSLVRDAIINKVINLYVLPDYEKDYVYINDLTEFTIKAISSNVTGTYNIASGENVSAKELVEIIEMHTGCKSVWHAVNGQDKFPIIDISKYLQLGFSPRKVNSMLIEMIHEFRKKFAGKD
ncbi:NAD-dependent epimerase/dehydratase family protein [Salmonella enterica]